MTELISARIDEDLKRRFEQKAQLIGKSVSDLLREFIVAVALYAEKPPSYAQVVEAVEHTNKIMREAKELLDELSAERQQLLRDKGNLEMLIILSSVKNDLEKSKLTAKQKEGAEKLLHSFDIKKFAKTASHIILTDLEPLMQ
jgi:antitoxin component of RelBE/YafQ-DinJ toxin-antitoxin module